MSKIKMRCTSCGKWFQSANAKEVTCPDCAQKARKEKLAAKNAPLSAHKPAGPTAQSPARHPTPPPKPRPAQGSASSWLDKLEGVKVSQPEPAPARPKLPSPPVQREGPGNFRGTPGPGFAGPAREERGERYERGPARGPGVYRFGSHTPTTSPPGQRPRPPYDGGGRGPYRPAGVPGGPKGGPRGKMKPKVQKPPLPPKPKREKTPPPQPFVPTPEQIKQVEARYLELAQPTEFDGIRTQIARELGIPKKAVKKIVKDLRMREAIPSWWETQTYKGSEEELEKIKTAYMPYLPVPPVGVHKIIADQLELKAGTVYQAIKAIRQELNLPQYNDPTLHEEELAALAKARQAARAAQAEQSTGQQPPEPVAAQPEQVSEQTQAPEPAVQTEGAQPASTEETAEKEAVESNEPGAHA